MLGSLKTASGQKAKAVQAPISSHPIFPVVVAVWFAALLGIGSLVLPITIFERIFSVTGISSVISATQAPLGVTARLLIAVSAAIAGAVAGLLIARKVIGAQANSPARTRFGRSTESGEAKLAVKPISAHEELGSESFDDPIESTPMAAEQSGYGGKRRALTLTDDSGKSDFLDSAPLPGGDSPYDNGSYSPFEHEAASLDPDLSGDDEVDFLPEVETAAEPLELAILADFQDADPVVEDETPSFAMPQVEPEPAPIANEQDQEFTSMTETSEAEASLPYNPFPNAAASPAEFSLPFKADSGQQDTAQASQPAVPQAFAHIDQAAPASADAPQSEQAEQPEQQVETTDLTGKPLNELGMVELVERFAIALQSKSAEVANMAEPGIREVQAVAPMVFRRSNTAETNAEAVMDEGVDAAPMTPPAVPTQPAMPAAFQPFHLEDGDAEEDDAELEDLSLSLASARAAKESVVADIAEPIDPDEEPDTDFSSLLSLKASTREFVRVEEEDDLGAAPEPVVVFPGQDDRRATPAMDGTPREPIMYKAPAAAPAAPRAFDAPNAARQARNLTEEQPDANQTERALREALEKLQRMSGAA